MSQRPGGVVRRIQRDRLLKRLTVAVAEHGYPTTVRKILDGSLVDFCVEEPEAARVGIVEVYSVGAKARALRGETMRELAAMLGPAFAELRPQESDPAVSAHGVLGGVLELLFEPLSRGDDCPSPAACGRTARGPWSSGPRERGSRGGGDSACGEWRGQHAPGGLGRARQAGQALRRGTYSLEGDPDS